MRYCISLAIHGVFVLAAFFFAAAAVPTKEKPVGVINFPTALPGPVIAHAALRAAAATASGGPRPAVAHRPAVARPSEPIQAETGGGGLQDGVQGGSGAQGPSSSEGGDGGVSEAPVGGGVAEYSLVAKAPARLEGEDAPAINATLLSTLRGSKGIVLVRLQLRPDGSVASASVVRSTLPLLDELVLRHVKTWRFAAPSMGGRPVAVQFLQPFSFSF